MYSPQAIQQFEIEAQRRAQDNEAHPYVPADQEIEKLGRGSYQQFPLTNLGSYVPADWTKQDSITFSEYSDYPGGTGFSGLAAWMKEEKAAGNYGFAITSEYQFGLEVSSFKPTPGTPGNYIEFVDCPECDEFYQPDDVPDTCSCGYEFVETCGGRTLYDKWECDEDIEACPFFDRGWCTHPSPADETPRHSPANGWSFFNDKSLEYRAGFAARVANWQQKDNPYSKYGLQYVDWDEGWLAGGTDVYIPDDQPELPGL